MCGGKSSTSLEQDRGRRHRNPVGVKLGHRSCMSGITKESGHRKVAGSDCAHLNNFDEGLGRVM